MARNFPAGAGNRVTGPGSMNGITTGCLSVWIKTTTAVANSLIVQCADVSNTRSGFGLAINNATTNKVTAFAYDATTQRVGITSATSVNTGSWVHLAYNFNTGSGSSQTLYVNGSSNASGTASAAWSFTASSSFSFGGAPSFWPPIGGDIAEIALWTRNLTADEIAALAKGFAPNKIALDALERYHPLAREVQDRVFGGTSTISLTVNVADHPRMVGGLT